ERFWRWCKRKPALATVAGLAIFATLATVVTLSIAIILISRSRLETRRQLAMNLIAVGNGQLAQNQIPEAHKTFTEAWDMAKSLGIWEMPAIAALLQCYQSEAPLQGTFGNLQWVGGFQGHAHGVLAVASSPDGRRVLTGGSDGRVILWELLTGRKLGEYPK